MNVFQDGLNLFKEIFIASVQLPASFTDVKMMNLSIKDILKSFAYNRKVQLLKDIKLLQDLNIPIDAGAINVRYFAGKVVLNVFQAQLFGLMVKNELDEKPSERRNTHFVDSEDS
jgi:hypothetical protein